MQLYLGLITDLAHVLGHTDVFADRRHLQEQMCNKQNKCDHFLGILIRPKRGLQNTCLDVVQRKIYFYGSLQYLTIPKTGYVCEENIMQNGI